MRIGLWLGLLVALQQSAIAAAETVVEESGTLRRFDTLEVGREPW